MTTPSPRKARPAASIFTDMATGLTVELKKRSGGLFGRVLNIEETEIRDPRVLAHLIREAAALALKSPGPKQ